MEIIKSKDGKSELKLTGRKVLNRFPERVVDRPIKKSSVRSETKKDK